jgi:excisionase family DNA binding protein
MSVANGPVEPMSYDYRDAERVTAISERSLRNDYKAGRLKGFRIGKHVRFHRDDLEAYLKLLREEEAQRQAERRKEAEPEPEPVAQRPRRRRRRVAA